MARIESVTIGARRPVANRVGSTGIYKQPVPVATVTRFEVVGDYVADGKYHGGPDQVIYLYRTEDYAWWSTRLGRDLAPGTFGDNITVSGLPEAMVIGDRIAAGAVVLEVSSPRTPCGTLAKRMGDPTFVKAFRHAERPGAYCRVVSPGELRAGMEAAYMPFAGERVSLVSLYRDLLAPATLGASRIETLLNLPVAERVRADLEKRLSKLGGGGEERLLL